MRGIGGEDEDGGEIVGRDAVLEMLDELEAGEALHVPVEEEEVWLEFAKLCEGLGGIRDGDADGVAGAAEEAAEGAGVIGDVIDDEDAGVLGYIRNRVDLHIIQLPTVGIRHQSSIFPAKRVE